MKPVVINPYIKVLWPPLKRKWVKKNITRAFEEFDFKYAHRTLVGKKSGFWENIGMKMALRLFREAARRVPAYKDFLEKNGVNPSHIQTINDFRKLPIVDKNNYLRAYPLSDLCWDGDIAGNSLFSVSSGSSGTPFFWPRGDYLEIETSIIHGLILWELFGAKRTSTLFVNSFSMGVYIAGVVILNSALRTSQRNFPISIITPGVEVGDALRAIREIGPNYSQVVLAGYPPFVKDIVDGGIIRGIDWKKFDVKFLFAAENFSETFRDYLREKTGQQDIYSSSVNIYGSADASILGHETPLTILMRRLALKDEEIFSQLFGTHQYVPTFVQYNPLLKFFEEINGQLIFSTYGGIPLVRYDIHDTGKLVRFADAYSSSRLSAYPEFSSILSRSWKLPFLHVSGRSDFAISFYGLKIFPENIKQGLEDKEVISFVSGKFVMDKKTRENQDAYWGCYVELKDGVQSSSELERMVKESIMKSLTKNNMEFKRLFEAIGEKAKPFVQLCAKGDERYFAMKSVKQKWTKQAGN